MPTTRSSETSNANNLRADRLQGFLRDLDPAGKDHLAFPVEHAYSTGTLADVETDVVAHDPTSLDRSQCTTAFTPVPMPLADSTLRSDEPRILMGGLYGDIPGRTGGGTW